MDSWYGPALGGDSSCVEHAGLSTIYSLGDERRSLHAPVVQEGVPGDDDEHQEESGAALQHAAPGLVVVEEAVEPERVRPGGPVGGLPDGRGSRRAGLGEEPVTVGDDAPDADL